MGYLVPLVGTRHWHQRTIFGLTRRKPRHSIQYAMIVIWWVIVGLIAGWATGKIMHGTGYGIILDIVIGIIGAIVGGAIMRALGAAASGGMIYTILVAILGAVVLTVIVRALVGSGSRRSVR